MRVSVGKSKLFFVRCRTTIGLLEEGFVYAPPATVEVHHPVFTISEVYGGGALGLAKANGSSMCCVAFEQPCFLEVLVVQEDF